LPHRGFDLSSDAIERSRRMMEQQLANMSLDTFRGVDSGRYQARLADAKPMTVLGRSADHPGDKGDVTVSVEPRCDECGNWHFHVLGCSRHAPGCAPSRIANDDGLKPLRPDALTPLTLRIQTAGPMVITGFTDRVQLRGKTGSSWDPARRQLEVYTAIDRDGVDRRRGLTPQSIIVRGRVSDYQPGVVAYLGEVLQPMVRDDAYITAYEDAELLRALGFPIP